MRKSLSVWMESICQFCTFLLSPDNHACTHSIATHVRSVDGASTYMRKRLTLGGGCLLGEPSGGETPARVENVSRITLSIPGLSQVPELGAMMRRRWEAVVACVIKT